MSELRGGAGGYGGIISLNTENRVSAYSPHTVVTETSYTYDHVYVKCLKCGETWFHPRGSKFAPSRCAPPPEQSEGVSAS
jgi:hypothetical protein